MEFFIFIALVVIFIIVLNIQSRQRSNADILKKDLSNLSKQIHDLQNQVQNLNTAPPPTVTAEQQQKEKETAELKAREEYQQKIAAIEEMRRQRELKQKAEEELAPQNLPVVTVEESETIEAPQIRVQPKPYVAKETVLEKWFKNNPDLEKFIGENLVNKIGIGVLVLAIGFFVKYAIDKNWVGPVGRVSIGILCGAILVSLAHKMRNTYRSFSSVLAGGGLAVFYFTITLAFHQFHLFSQTLSFIIMIVITLFAVLLSLLYNKQELAIIALVGGFLAPFLVSTGTGNYIVLFTYLVILNCGLLIIAYNKSWRLLNFLNFIFTVITFTSWLFFLHYGEKTSTYKNAFLFVTVFYLQFFLINIAYNIKEKKKFITSDFGILLTNSCFYFGTGIFCIIKMQAPEYKGVFSASLGVFNLVATYFLFRKQKVDTNILYLLMGITLTFISITAPIQLHGNYITIFWASECVLLYWLYTKSQLRIIQISSIIVWILMLISLLMDWTQVYTNNFSSLAIITNKGFITSVVAALATYLLFILRKSEDENSLASTPGFIPGKNIFRITAIILLYAAGALEISYQFNYHYPDVEISILYLLLYTLAFILIMTVVTQNIKSIRLNEITVSVMMASSLLFYLVSLPQTYHLQRGFLQLGKYNNHFIAHWLSAALIFIILYRLIQSVKLNKAALKNSFDFFTWILCVLIVLFLSVEIHLLCNSVFYTADNPLNNIYRIYIKTGLPILWGLCSFAFMWLGMHYKFRTLRIISLSLFTLTLLKLFIFDIRNIPAAGKIAAFFSLGVLLLVVSFMYQRLKKIIIDDEKKVD